MSKEPHSVGDVVEGLEELAEKEEKVSFGDVLDEFGNRSFAPIILVLALLELTPIGGIPGVPSALAACIALIAAQLLFAREHIWVPGFIEKRAVKGKSLHKGTDKLDGIAEKMDSLVKGRLKWLTRGRALQVAAALIIILCATVPPLEVLPFASSGPMIAIAIMALAIMVRDGLAMLFGGLVAVAALGLGTYFYWTKDDGEKGSSEDSAMIACLAPDFRHENAQLLCQYRL